MKSILFENGKLYVVELPEKPTYCESQCRFACKCINLENEYDKAYSAAIANKVEVKNPELIARWITNTHMCTLDNKHILDNETFPLPDGIEVVKEPVCHCNGIRHCGEDYEPCNLKLMVTLKRIEPEKTEEDTNVNRALEIAGIKVFIEKLLLDEGNIDNIIKVLFERFTIQRNKS